MYGLFGNGLGTTQVLLWMGLGTLLIFFGVALLSSRFVKPLVVVLSPVARWAVFAFTVLVWPFFLLPYWLLRYGAWGPGALGKRVAAFVGGAILNPLVLLIVLLMMIRRAVTSWRPEWPAEFPGVVPDQVTARTGADNSKRNPQRTASTAAALMIGLALVTLVATLAAGIVHSFTSAVDDIFTGDYSITAQNNFNPIPIAAAQAAAQAPGVIAVGSVRTGDAQAFRKTIFATAVDPGAKDVIRLTWIKGSQADAGEPRGRRRVRRRRLREAARLSSSDRRWR